MAWVKGCIRPSDTYGTPHLRIRRCVEFRSFYLVVVGDRQLGGLVDAAAVVGLADPAFHALAGPWAKPFQRSGPWTAQVGTWCYRRGMGVRKLSVALEESVAAQAADAAQRSGVSLSAWLNAAAERALLIERGLAGVAGWEAEHGALSGDELAWADSVLDRSVTDRAAS